MGDCVAPLCCREFSGEGEDDGEEILGEGPGLGEAPDEDEEDNTDEASEAQIYSACQPRDMLLAAAKQLTADAGNQGEPDSFSRVHNLDRDDAELKKEYPQFPGKAAAIEITVNEGALPESCPCSVSLLTWRSSAKVDN